MPPPEASPNTPRRPGRPRVERPAGAAPKVPLTSEVEPDFAEVVRKAATKRGLSVSALIRLLLSDELARQGLEK